MVSHHVRFLQTGWLEMTIANDTGSAAVAGTSRRSKSSLTDTKRTLCAQLTVPVNTTCEMLGVCRTSIYSLIRDRELEAVKIAGRTVITTDSIRQLIERAPAQARAA